MYVYISCLSYPLAPLLYLDLSLNTPHFRGNKKNTGFYWLPFLNDMFMFICVLLHVPQRRAVPSAKAERDIYQMMNTATYLDILLLEWHVWNFANLIFCILDIRCEEKLKKYNQWRRATTTSSVCIRGIVCNPSFSLRTVLILTLEQASAEFRAAFHVQYKKTITNVLLF